MTRTPWLGPAFLGALWILLATLGPERLDHWPSLCLLDRLHWICPGCGMTRALAALARFDLAEAVRFHPLAPAVALGLLCLAARPLFLRPRPLGCKGPEEG